MLIAQSFHLDGSLLLAAMHLAAEFILEIAFPCTELTEFLRKPLK